MNINDIFIVCLFVDIGDLVTNYRYKTKIIVHETATVKYQIIDLSKMAASSSGLNLSPQPQKAVQNLSKDSTDHEIGIENTSRRGLLTYMLNCDI